MDKKRQYGLFFLLGGMMVVFFIIARPMTFRKMNHLKDETEIINCIVHVMEREKDNVISKTIPIHQEQFDEIADLMSAFRYCKVWGKKDHDLLDRTNSIIDIEYLVEGENLFRRISFTGGGYIYIDDELLPYKEIHDNTEHIVLKLENYLEGIIE